jgi:hypothetical protein
MKIISKWANNPKSLVDKINKSNSIPACKHLISNSEQHTEQSVFRAELKYKKFVILILSGGTELPIFEGIDKVVFAN